METYKLRIQLKSETSFGRGDGLAGVVDREIEHDAYGLPYVRGRTLKGLLVEECANILYALSSQNPALAEKYEAVATRLFGRPGSDLEDSAILHFSDACLPEDLQLAVQAEVEGKRLSRLDVLEALTEVRRQTAVDNTGVPDPHSLRSMRVLLPVVFFEAQLTFLEVPIEADLNLLTACTLALRQAGTGRNRGKGQIAATLYDAHYKEVSLDLFEQEVQA